MKPLWRFASQILLAALGVHAGTTLAQSYPSRPIRIVVPFAAGGGLEYVSWQGLFVPAKTPRDIVELIQREAVKALNMPDVRDRFLAMSMELVGSTPEEFDARYRADFAKFARIVKEARIPLQD